MHYMSDIRISVGFDAEQAEWVQDRAEELDRSKAEIVRRALDFARESGAPLNDDASNTTAHHTDGRIDDLENVVGELAERIDGIERELAANSKSTSEPLADGASDADTADTDVSASIDAALADWQPGRSVDEREARRASGRATVAWLRQVGKASAGEFKTEAYPEYGLDGQSADTWWEKTGRPAISAAVDAGLVEYKRNAGYRWVGR